MPQEKRRHEIRFRHVDHGATKADGLVESPLSGQRHPLGVFGVDVDLPHSLRRRCDRRRTERLARIHHRGGSARQPSNDSGQHEMRLFLRWGARRSPEKPVNPCEHVEDCFGAFRPIAHPRSRRFSSASPPHTAVRANRVRLRPKRSALARKTGSSAKVTRCSTPIMRISSRG
ncbi:hypothetical protein FQZ97_641400 [compost metagenome]